MECGVNTVRHGKRKVNQETQAPLLQLFKDVMLREASDQEKISLLNDRPDCKRNQYSTESKTTLSEKPSRPTVQAQKKDSKVKGKKSEKRLDRPFARQFHTLRADNKKQSKQNCFTDVKCSDDDTFSCNSCAFKRILFREYKLPCMGGIPGIAILVALFLAAIYFATGGCSRTHCYGLEHWFKDTESEDLRTIDRPDPKAEKGVHDETKGDKGARNVQIGLVGRLKDNMAEYRERIEPMSYLGNSMESNVPNDGYDSLSGMSYLNNLEANLRATESKELEKIMGNNKDFRTNGNLQHFYEKLLATDAQIQKLKKSSQGSYNEKIDSELTKGYFPRYKRSLRKFKRPFFRTRVEKKHSGAEDLNATMDKTFWATARQARKGSHRKNKMSADGTLRQTTVDLHNEGPPKVLIQTKDITKLHRAKHRKSKCTHVMSDSKSHETELKNPFYKNSQRLDEILDKMLDKNMNHILTDPLQDEPLFKHNHSKKGKFAKGIAAEKSKVFTPKPTRLAVSEHVFDIGRFLKKPFSTVHEKKKDKVDSNIPLLVDEFPSNCKKMMQDTTTISSTVETTMALDRPYESDDKKSPNARKNPNPERKPAVIVMPSRQLSHQHLTAHAPNLRRILQVGDGYDSSLYYADRKEVLNDELDPHEDAKEEQPDDSSRHIIYTIPNWNGPMLLYSDEIRDLVSAPPAFKSQKDSKMRALRNTEKLEDYDSRDAQAQAYSDYGVLEGKKDLLFTPPPEVTVVSSKYNFKRDNYIQPEASLKIIRKREADAPAFELVEKTKNFKETDHLLSVLSQWFSSFLTMANGSEPDGKNKSVCLAPNMSSPTTKAYEYSQVTQHHYRFSRYPSPRVSAWSLWRARSLLSVDEDTAGEESTNEIKVGVEKIDEDKVSEGKADADKKGEGKVGNNTEAISEENTGRNVNKSMVERTTDGVLISTESASDNPVITMKQTTSQAPEVILNATKVAENNREKNKSVVKRHAPPEEKGLTFWNNVYDDEYGVQIDSLNEPVGTAKSSVELDVSKRPKNWFRQKYRNIKSMVHHKESGGPKGAMKRRIRDTRMGVDSILPQTHGQNFPTSQPMDTPGVLETPDEKPVSFHELTLKMKNVVNQAAKAVEETDTPHAQPTLPLSDSNANATEPDVGNSLMRQLMRMMSEVMDYQVHARSCLQPPEDLRVFLVQLTAPDPGRRLRDVDDDEGLRTDGGYFSDGEMLSSKPADWGLSRARDHSRPQGECLEALRTVQGLMMEYDMLSDEDKKQMVGVKDYLQKQIDFLRNQCSSSYSDFSFDLAPYYQDNLPVQRVRRHGNQASSKQLYTGKRNKNNGRFVKLRSKTSPDAGLLTTNRSDSIRSLHSSDDKLQVAKHFYDMGLKPLRNLNFDMDGENGKSANFDLDGQKEKSHDDFLNKLQKSLSAEKSHGKSIGKFTALPTPDFQNAILEPAFQDAHKGNVVHFNDAKRLYEKSLREYQDAKETLGKSKTLDNLHRFQNSVKKIELAKKVYKDSVDSLKKVNDIFSRPKKRNLYDVYYRAVSEAKKMASTTESRNS